MRFVYSVIAFYAFVNLGAVQAHAQETDSGTTSKTTELDQLVITPTRTSRTVDSSLSSVKIIDEEKLRQQNPKEMSDLLRGQPGLDVSTNGSFGKTTSVYSRGMGSGSTLLLIDGVRMRSVTTGSPSWQYLPPALVERVEIVRGPRASLYGSDAMGGVVQLFTTDEDANGGWMQASGGSFNTEEIGAGFSSEDDGTRLHLGFDRFRTGGSELREDGQEKGYDNTAFVTGLSHQFDNGAKVGVSGFRANGTTEYIDGRTDYMLQTSRAYGRAPLTDWWTTRLQVSEARDESRNFSTSLPMSIFDTQSRMANWKNVFLFGSHEVVVGSDVRRDEIESTADYAETERDNVAGFIQALLRFGDMDFQASGRYDDNDAYGHKTTASVSLGYQLSRHYRLRASHGTAFRAPTFNDLYYPSSMFFSSNDELKPESSETSELGMRGQYRSWFWDLALFRTDAEDLIVTVNDGGTFKPANVNEARIDGAELAMGMETDQWTLQASYTALDPRNEETDNVLRRRARHSGRIDVDRNFDKLSLGASVIGQSERYNDAANTRKLKGFALVNLRAGWSFSEDWSAKIDVKNALDKQYATAYNSFDGFAYINAGRAAYLSIQYGQR